MILNRFRRRPRRQFYRLMQVIDDILDENEKLKEGYREWGGLLDDTEHARIQEHLNKNHLKIEKIGRYANTLFSGVSNGK